VGGGAAGGIGVSGLGRADYLALQVVVSTQLIVNGPTYYLSDTKASNFSTAGHKSHGHLPKLPIHTQLLDPSVYRYLILRV
jgi:hypothetical protein